MSRRSLRRQVSRMRRARQWRAERKLYESEGKTVGRLTYQAKEIVRLEARNRWGRVFVAKYEKSATGEKWKLASCDEAIEFLRYFGKPEDARKAMEKRGLTWKWS